MTRLKGFLFRYPGFPSLVVAYHDSNDFYYSGHVGTCFILVLEAYYCRWYKLSFMCFFIMCNQWAMMMFIRTHYVVDMVTGLVVANYVHMIGDRVSYFVDHKWMRMHKTAPLRRERVYFKACADCGWLNKCAKDFLPKEEKERLKAMYREQQDLA